MPTNSQAHLPPDGAFCFAQLSIMLSALPCFVFLLYS